MIIQRQVCGGLRVKPRRVEQGDSNITGLEQQSDLSATENDGLGTHANEFRDDFDLGWPMLLLMKLGKPIDPAGDA